MDVKFINPFIYGTIDVMEKMAFIKPVPGKPYAKVNDTACGDISGIIGMTGDATGSLALSFKEACIIGIVGKMLGETYTELNRPILDAVGELTNMISGASRKLMEKDDLKVFAAIPTIVFGRAHSVRHVIKGPSIVLPFQTEYGEFVIDVCLKSSITQHRDLRRMPGFAPPAASSLQMSPQKGISEQKVFNPKAHNPAVFGKPAAPKADSSGLSERIEKDLSGAISLGQQDPAERINYLRKIMAEANDTRDEIMKQLKEQPFMDPALRQRYKKALPAYDTKIKRLKLDIMAAETILRMSGDNFDNPEIKPHYQHHPGMTGPAKPVTKK